MATTADSFLTLYPRVTPRWAKRAKVRALLSQVYAQADAVVDRLAGSISARCVELAPDDALDAVGGTSGLRRAPGEGASAFRSYLRDPWARWYKAGSDLGLQAELSHLGFPNAEIHTYWSIVADGGDPAVVFGGFTSFFYVALPSTGAFVPPGDWNGGGLWRDGALWGIGGDPHLLAAVRAAIAVWKPADTSCRFVSIALGGSTTVVPLGEPWEVDRATGAFREFYHYSHLQERI